VPFENATIACINRRSLLAWSGAALAANATATGAQAASPSSPMAAASGNDALAFQVYRNGSPIGSHTITVDRSGNGLRVHIAADFRVCFGFITLFRYRLRALEEWQDGQFMALDSSTDSNGRLYQVRARRHSAGICITALGAADQMVGGQTLPLTHWSQADMHAPVFNPQTGKMLPDIARCTGPGLVRMENGQQISATGYRLGSTMAMQDWYDQTGRWAALDARAPDGSAITYRRA
jgi:hypothetical protein